MVRVKGWWGLYEVVGSLGGGVGLGLVEYRGGGDQGVWGLGKVGWWQSRSGGDGA